jgi:Mg chelatase-like protein
VLIKVFGAAVQGIDATLITIEVNSSRGCMFYLVGLPDSAVKESHQRIISALQVNGYKMPTTNIVVNMAPADIRKEGSAYDLPLAIGLLGANETISSEKFSRYLLMGELSLDGSIQPIKGALPIAIKAREDGFEGLIIPQQNAREAAVVNQLKVYGVSNIREVIEFFNNERELEPTIVNTREEFYAHQSTFEFDFADVKGQENVKRALEVAAAGGHNLIMIGAPGSGKSMMAKRLPSILPPLSLGESLETTKIHSVAGKLNRNSSLITQRPFRDPHHTISQVILVYYLVDKIFFLPLRPYKLLISFLSMKCILLVRVSTEAQSYDEQEKELYDLAHFYGYKDKDISSIATKESAIKLDEEERFGLNRMKELLETGEYDCVFAWEISRIARRKKILFSILEYLTSKGIQLIIKEPRIRLLKDDKTIDEGAETIFTLYAQLAESEMRNKIARFARAKKEGFNKGKYMGGKITLGYKVSEDGYWEIDEEGSKLVRLIFDMYISGEYSLTGLGKELKSRGYFKNLSVTSIKVEMSHLLKNPIYRGIRTSNNIYPQIIDDDTWEQCCKKRKENRTRSKTKTPHLLTPLIRCICNASYSVNLMDGTYSCRVKHNAVEKGLTHSPDVNVNMIESLAWYVALQELHEDMVCKRSDAKKTYEEEIKVYNQKIAHSRELLESTMKRRSDLDENYFVHGRFTKEKYEELTQKQNDIIKTEQSNIRKFETAINSLQQQIQADITFDDMLDALGNSYEHLKNGTTPETMRKIIHRYITEINVEPVEGRRTVFWKKVIIHTPHDAEKQAEIKCLREQGLSDVAITITNVFYVDTYHKKAYWDKDMQNCVPMVYIQRLERKRGK